MNPSEKKPTEKKQNNSTLKQKYEKPLVKKIGSLKDLSQTFSNGGGSDGGAFPYNKMMCLTPPSALEEHRILLSDSVCQKSYFKQIQNQIKAGDVVLDLGTGSGLHTLFALRSGAKKVYAIDMDPLIEAAKKVIAQNNYSESVEFIQGYSREIELPEKVDVIISNIGFLYTVNDLHDAAIRFLKPGGKMIPDAVSLSLSPIESPEFYAHSIENWVNNSYGFDFSELHRLALHHPHYWTLKNERHLAATYTSPPITLKKAVKKILKWSNDFKIKNAGTLHGIGGWYSFFTNEQEFLSTRPPHELSKELWQNFIFPLAEPLQVQPGDSLHFTLSMHREIINEAPIWVWETSLNQKSIFRQSSFEGVPISQPLL